MYASRRALALLTAALGLAAWGCAAQRAAVRPPAGYDRMIDSLSSVDPSVLRGRRIALDPGHGGYFRGALGVHGLTEAEVNLAVARKLRDLLVASGADVLLTREGDEDYLTPADSALRADLAERVRRATEFAPDLFISVHHNADAGGKHNVNETQTYYKLGDEGASLDVAQDVHRALVRNVGIPTHKVVPGNYYVLRNTAAPALLTETSYITNPDVEVKLRDPAKQELEAQALYLGIARYFARPVPVIEALDASPLAATDEVATGREHAGPLEIRARVAGAFDVATLEVDGATMPLVRVDSVLWWRPSRPLSQGGHRAVLRVRRTGVGAARDRALEFAVHRPPARLAVTFLPEALPMDGASAGPSGMWAGVRIAVLDSLGLSDPDSTKVRLVVRGADATSTSKTSGAKSKTSSSTASRSRGKAALDTTLIARDGVAWGYVRIPAGAWTARASLPATSISAERTLRTGSTDVWSGFVTHMPGDSALVAAPGTAEPERVLPWLTRDGFATTDRGPEGAVLPVLPGFRAWGATRFGAGATRTSPPRVVAIAGGALHGKRIVLDPDGGGDQSGGLGKSGTRAANLNLDVARALGAMLSAAGAEVRLTRDGDVALSELERVQISEAFRADRFLRIGHRAEPPRIGYYFSSAGGKRWGAALAAECARIGLAAPPSREDAQYPLQQTSCPSLYAALARVDDPASEDRLVAPGAVRTEAWALWLALAREWSDGYGWRPDSLAVQEPDGRPAAGVAVRLGGALLAETDPRGVARFVRTEPGPLEVAIEGRGPETRRLLLESERGITLTGPIRR